MQPAAIIRHPAMQALFSDGVGVVGTAGTVRLLFADGWGLDGPKPAHTMVVLDHETARQMAALILQAIEDNKGAPSGLAGTH